MLASIQIITDLPIAFSIGCVLLGFIYSYFLYRNDKKFLELAKAFKYLMFGARWIVVSVLAFLLLTPFIKTVFNKIEQPIVVIAQDNSSSIRLNKDSSYYDGPYFDDLKKLETSLKTKFDVRTLTFSDKVQEGIKDSLTGKVSNLSNLFEAINNKYYNQNVGAVILASDGIYNEGTNPVYTAPSLGVPVYTIALGDTTTPKDIVLNEALSNKITFLGNKFPIHIEASAMLCDGLNSELTIIHEGEIVFSKKYIFSNKNQHIEEDILLEASKVGIQQYQVRLTPVDGEISLVNNEKNIFVEVLDGRQEVLVLYEAPHPDIKAIKQSIDQNENYKVSTFSTKEFDNNFEPYSLIIFHQIKGGSWVQKAKEMDVSMLFFLDGKADVDVFNGLNTGLKIEEFNGRVNNVQGVYNEQFSLFSLSEESSKRLKKFPPVTNPFGRYKLNSAGAVLLNQKIGSVETQTPLLSFFYEGDKKIGIFAGEGIWRWKMEEYLVYENQNAFNELIAKTIQFLSVKENKSRFRISVPKNNMENENILFRAEVYDKNYTLTNDPDVKLQIISENQDVFNFEFNKNSYAYVLDAGMFPPGKYSYLASTEYSGVKMDQKGFIIINELQLEAQNTIANHQLLVNLSTKFGGDNVLPTNMESLVGKIVDNKEVAAVIYEQKELKELINLKLIFYLIITLLALEWFIRKRNGAY